MRTGTGAAWLLVALAAAAPVARGQGTAWRPLLNGTDLSGWDTFMSKPDPAWDVPGMTRDAQGNYTADVGRNRDPLGVFKVEATDGRPAVHITGQGFGVMTTREVFGNFHLRLQFKWGERRWGKKATAARDSGLLYFGQGDEGAVDGNWPRSVEMQIQEHDTGDLYALGTQISVRARAAGTPPPLLYLYDPAGAPTLFEQRAPIGNRCVKLEDREKPNGQWNTLELIVLGDQSIHIVNGGVVMRLTGARKVDGTAAASLTSGRISLQTEGAELFYRDVEIRPIKDVPAEFSRPSSPSP
ncbi:MAG: DUF1080 domain-containing protein [Vicinamibacterales bacterium]